MNHRTVIKYVGNKQSYMQHIACHFDWSGVKRYIEPFCGSLGSAINANIPDDVEVILADKNWEMINLHEQCATNSQQLETLVNSFAPDEATYYHIRSWDRISNMRATYTPLQIAARTIYLNRHCFNGLYRVNRDGQFNVAWNRDSNVKLINMVDFTKAIDTCQRAKLSIDDYVTILHAAGEGDLVYCDPPYVNLMGSNAKFNGYIGAFDWCEHVRLHDELVLAHKQGAKIYTTNAAFDVVKQLYHEFNIISIGNIKRTLSPNGTTRGHVTELLMVL